MEGVGCPVQSPDSGSLLGTDANWWRGQECCQVLQLWNGESTRQRRVWSTLLASSAPSRCLQTKTGANPATAMASALGIAWFHLPGSCHTLSAFLAASCSLGICQIFVPFEAAPCCSCCSIRSPTLRCSPCPLLTQDLSWPIMTVTLLHLLNSSFPPLYPSSPLRAEIHPLILSFSCCATEE